ncbi:aminopeptidase [Paenibacillus thiaminolyticus]|uniref:aminopeptidase n=1 Tax=Paenibacillus thiaminolyticus TaxID=49283 RepID=UPI002175DC38|nr:aminopeptidase [Paenibacillus thiaminolyticus]
MMKDFTEKLDKYAELEVKVGVNIQQGQTLVIKTTLDAAELVRLIVKKAYKAGANDVVVPWSDDAVDRLCFEMAPEETLRTFSDWNAKEREEFRVQGFGVYVHRLYQSGLAVGNSPGTHSQLQQVQGNGDVSANSSRGRHLAGRIPQSAKASANRGLSIRRSSSRSRHHADSCRCAAVALLAAASKTIAPVVAMDWGEMDCLEEARFMGKLLGLEREGEQRITRYLHKVRMAKHRLEKHVKPGDTVAMYEIREDGKITEQDADDMFAYYSD